MLSRPLGHLCMQATVVRVTVLNYLERSSKFESNARGGLRTTYYSEIPNLRVSTCHHHQLDLQVRGKRCYACAIVAHAGLNEAHKSLRWSKVGVKRHVRSHLHGLGFKLPGRRSCFAAWQSAAARIWRSFRAINFAPTMTLYCNIGELRGRIFPELSSVLVLLILAWP